MAYPQKTFIIAVGIDKYKLKEIKNFEADSCKNDCDEIVKLLVENFIDFEQHGQTLKDSKATRQNIINLIKSFTKDPAKNNRNNSLIIYFSGHGEAVAEGGGAQVGSWVPHDCKSLVKDQVLANRVLVDLFTDIDTRDFLLISDSCDSGRLFELEFQNSTLQASVPRDPPMSRWGMVSSRMNQLSVARGKHSFFTGKLL
ncbi:MAG TPA: caspase family protein, partial [Dyadobacter sp.]|nr:caspase family protein [Dyadobacter sp.]